MLSRTCKCGIPQQRCIRYESACSPCILVTTVCCYFQKTRNSCKHGTAVIMGRYARLSHLFRQSGISYICGILQLQDIKIWRSAIAGYWQKLYRVCGITFTYNHGRWERQVYILVIIVIIVIIHPINKFLAKIWHTIKPGSLEHGTPAEQRDTPEQWRNNGTPRNTSRTPAEHPGIPTEQQCNANGTPRNNETTQNEEIL